jgi:hypothetical protein
MGDEHIIEASSVADVVSGFSALLHGVDYDLDQWLEELDAVVKHIESQAG